MLSSYCHLRTHYSCKYETDKPNEFFLVENRSQLDLDFYLPSSGLAIYHCDTLGSNEWQNRTKDRHYQVALLQADGKNDLENNRNSGDTGDLYDQVNGVALSRVTTPSSRKWDGSDSGLTVLDIGKPGKIISFRIGRSTVSKAGGEAREAVSIPAADPSGASSKILIHQTGKVKSIEITVDITHTYIGDLQVELQAPSGKSVLLHNRTKGSQDNLMETYRSGELQSLAVMKGESIQGYWVLHIRDRTDFDTGRLNRWQIEIDYETIDDS